MKLYLLVLLFIFSFYSSVFAQKTALEGVIRNATNQEVMVGVTIQQKGTFIGTSTDEKGRYKFVADSSTGTLILRYFGMKTKEISFSSISTTYNIELEEDAETLEAVVIGFKQINVYSRRREENLQRIPESVTAFSAQQIEEKGIQSVENFIALTPNVTFIDAQNAGNIAITTRGISQVRNGDAPVAYVVDGVTLPSPNSINQELYDVELIEVMKGPQGALYGRNAIGGAINILTKKPTNDYKHGVRLMYGNGNAFKANLNSSGRIIRNKLLYRVSSFYQHRDGLIENTTLDKKVDYLDQFGARGQLLANISPRLTLDASVAYSKINGGAVYYIPLQDGQSNNYNNSVTSDSLGYNTRSLLDAYLKFRYDAGKLGDIEWIHAYSTVDEVYGGDLDFTSISSLAQRQALYNKGFIEELRITSPSSQKLRWTLGGFMMLNQRNLITTGSIDLASDLARAFGLPEGVGFIPIIEREEANNNSTFAGFGQINYDLLPKLEFSAAFRYDLDRRKQTNVATEQTREKDFGQFQPKTSLSYKATEDLLIYGSYSQGFRSGGFNAPGIETFPAIFDKETTQNFEIGFKSSFLDNRIIFNTAAFYINFQNQQTFIIDIATVAQGIINIDNTISRGFESELQVKPHPNFQISSAFGLTDTEITKLLSNPEWEGNKSPLVANTTFNLGFQYKLPVSEKLNLLSSIDTERRGKLYWHIDNEDFQNDFWLLNARMSLRHQDWNVAIFGNNLLNTQYNVEFFAREFSGGATDVRWLNQPLSFGVSLGYDF